MIFITDQNAFYLRVTAQTKAGSQMADVDLSVIKWLVAQFVRRGRSLQSMEIDSQGRAVIFNSGDLAMGVYGVEFNGYYNGQPWRFFEKKVFAIVDQTVNAVEQSGEINGIPVFDVTLTITLGGEGVPESYVTNAINEHDNDMNAHPYLQELIENAGEVDDVKVNGLSVVDENKEANINITATIDGNVGEPEVDVEQEDGEIRFAFKNMKGEKGETGPEGPQGRQGDSVIVGEGDLPLTHVLGSDNSKAISQMGVTDVVLSTDRSIDLSQYTAENVYISNYLAATNPNKWTTGSVSANCIFIAVSPGTAYRVTGNSSYAGNFAFLTTDSYTTGQTPSYAGDATQRTNIAAGETITVTAPANAAYMYVMMKSSGNDISPTITVMLEVKENVRKIEDVKGASELVSSLHITKRTISLGSYSAVNNYINASNVWVAGSVNNQCILIPIEPNWVYKIKANDSFSCLFAFLSAPTIEAGSAPSFATGCARSRIDIGETVYVTAPSDAAYLYLLTKLSGDVHTPASVVATRRSDDKIKDLSDEVSNVDNNFYSIRRLSLVDSSVKTYSTFYITSQLKWTFNTNAACKTIPIVGGKTYKITANTTQATDIVFLTARPASASDITPGDSADIVVGTIKYAVGKNKTVRLTAPASAKFMYVLTQFPVSGVVYDYTPVIEEEIAPITAYLEEVVALKTEPDKRIDAQGELITLTGTSAGLITSRKYEIEQGVNYYANVRVGSTSTLSSVAYFAADNSYIGTDDIAVPSGEERNIYKMKLNVPTNAKYVWLVGTSDTTTSITLWPARLYKEGVNSVTPLVIEYHTAKIKKNVLISNNYDDSATDKGDPTNGTKIECEEIDSGWAVMWPTTYTPFGTPTQIIAMLHGSEGYVNSSVMGYTTSTWVNWRKRYLAKGYAVVDINGLGVMTGNTANATSKHFGCPQAVETLDKAFEFLKANYNVCDKLLIHGTSMGGSLAQTYTKTYPEKVLAVAVFAPAPTVRSVAFNTVTSEGLMAKLYGYGTSESTGSEAYAAAKSDNFANMVGHVPMMRCLVWKNGTLTEMSWSEEVDNKAETEAGGETYTYPIFELVETFPVPIRCWQGSADTNVLPKYSKELIDAYRRGNSIASLRVCKAATHSIVNGSVDYVVEEAIEYFERMRK